MKRTILFSMLLLGILFSSSSSAQKKIKLYQVLDSSYTIYETKLAIVFLNNKDITKLTSTLINSPKPCEKQKKHYTQLQTFYSTYGKTINYIILPKKDASLVKELPSPQKTGFAPLDFFVGLTWLNLSQPYIPPYGYKASFADSLNYTKLDTLYKSIVNELLLEGKGRVLNKSTQLFENWIYLDELDFRDGHGGRNFLFQNKEMFYNLDWYGDLGRPLDEECE